MSGSSRALFISVNRLLFGLLLLFAGWQFLAGQSQAQSVTRGYGSDQTLQRGMIVGVSKVDPTKVETVDITNIKNILGVVVSQNDSPITLSDANQKVFVTTAGRYDVLVSDENGNIKPQDYVTLSSVGGIGMRASQDQANIVGRSVGSFDAGSRILSTTVLSDKKGGQKTIHIGRVAVEINISKNPLAKTVDSLPSFLGSASRAIAGKQVSALRVYLSAILFLAGTLVAGTIMYAGVKSGVSAVGRNPLSRHSIFKSLTGVAFLSFLVFLVSAIGVYLLLKL